MAVEFRKARDFVYANGVLWEQALFAYLFQNGSIDRLHQCLLCYKNPDGGWGHGMEHDIKTTDSHPLALEFLLTVVRETGIPTGTLFDDSAAWVERHRNDDGSLKNPPSVLDYPHAPWWNEGGQAIPASITGNLMKLGLCSPSLAESTKRWVEKNLTLEKIKANEWIFMAYHAFDYFMNVRDLPNVEIYRQATLENIVELAEKAPDKQYYHLCHYVPSPRSPQIQAFPDTLIQRNLNYLASTQRDNGGWSDEHGLKHWEPYVTILVLLTLKNHGKVAL